MTFVTWSVFGRTAENVGQYMRKGRPILVEGRLRYEQWDDKQLAKGSKLGVVRKQFNFSAARPVAGEGGAPATPRAARPAAASSAPAPEGGDAEPPHDDDVPF